MSTSDENLIFENRTETNKFIFILNFQSGKFKKIIKLRKNKIMIFIRDISWRNIV